MPEPAPTSAFSFRPCQLLLSTTGTLLALDKAGQEQSGLSPQSFPGIPLREFLARLNPRWDGPAAAEAVLSHEQHLLPWEPGPPASAFGIEARCLRTANGLVLSLSPGFAPELAATGGLANLSGAGQLPPALLLRLQQAEDRLRIYAHHFPGVLFQQRADLSFAYLSPRFGQLFQQDPQPFTRHGSRWLEFIYEGDRDYYLQETARQTAQGEAFTLTYRVRLPGSGHILYLQDVRTPQRLPSGLLLGYEGVWLDVTRQSLAEKRLTSAGWKENLATLTSGLLHDFKNTMTGIGTLSELYCHTSDASHPWHEGLTLIRQSALSAQATVQRIMDLHREEFGKKNYYNLPRLLQSQIDLLRLIMPKHLRVEAELPTAELPVYLDEVGFRQLVLNLAINSRDASPSGGTLGIALRPVRTGEPWGDPARRARAPGDGAWLTVRDQGEGIAPENLPHVFDPYFTTKEIAKGSGLGLYNVRLFIDEIGGAIQIASTLGEGTSVHVFLPQATFMEALGMEAPAPAKPVRRVVIYSQTAADTLLDFLQEEACEVLSFARASDLRQFLAESDPPALCVLLCPRLTPEIHQLTEDLRQRHPKLRLVRVHPPLEDPDQGSGDPAVFDLESTGDGNQRRLALQLRELMV